MSIPQLSTCCCGCSLKTGTKIIGWFSLVAAALMLVMSFIGLVSLFYVEDHPDTKPETQFILAHLPALKALTMFMIVVHIVACCLAFMLLMGTYQVKLSKGKTNSTRIPLILLLVPITVWLVCGLLKIYYTSKALSSVYNKAKLIFYWVIIALTTALVEQSLNLIEAVAFSQPAKLLNFLFFLVDLYFILVVYSFYREIRNMSDYA